MLVKTGSYVPVEKDRSANFFDKDMVFEIINLMSYLPGNDEERVMQLQISRIVLYNLAMCGFDEAAVRSYNAIASKTLDFCIRVRLITKSITHMV